MTATTCRRAVPKTVFLLLTATLCVEAGCAAQRQESAVPTASASAGAMTWQPWRAAREPLSGAEAELQADLTRHVEMSMAVRDIQEAFPLAGDLFNGRIFWAAIVVPDSDVTHFVAVIYERHGGGWSEVARHEMLHHIPGPVAPVRIDPVHAWIIVNGGNGARGIPIWIVLRFDGESVHEEFVANWFNVMLVDVDLDGTLEIFGEDIAHVRCYYCGLSSRSVDLYRWNGAELAQVGFETLAAGSAYNAVVAANNRAAELANAGRWAEALAVVDGARYLVAESAVFRRNASLIDLNAPGPGRDYRSDDTFLHYVFAGLWADAVDILRLRPILPDFFATPPANMEYMWGFGTPPFLGAVYQATTAARRVAPALPEIEFLRGWAAYHLRDWAAWLDRRDRSDPSTESKFWSSNWSRLVEPGESVVLESLERAAALAPNDPLFAEAVRLVQGRAEMAHADAMRRVFLLFDYGSEFCDGPGCLEPRRPPGVSADIGVTSWRRWQPRGDTARRLADLAGGSDLIRRHGAVYRRDGESIQQARVFPLAGTRFDGRSFWAVFDPAADTCRARRLGVSINFSSDCTAPVLAVYERRDGGWREVTQRRVVMDVVSVVAPVDVEPSQSWVVTRGMNNRNSGANEPRWEILRFDGEFLQVEVVGSQSDVMFTDVDLDGALEMLTRATVPLCERCLVTRRIVRLYRWTGTRMAKAPLEMLSPNAASAAAVAANNRAVELARARRWAEAVAVLDDYRPLVAESAVFRRNVSLIDLSAGAGGERLSEEPLLHHVLAGQWTAAVDLFRDAPAGPDLFAARPYGADSAESPNGYGAPPFLRAIFDATAAARAVAPPRPEIEFLHAWSAFHLDPDTTAASSISWRDGDYQIDVDDRAVLEVFERAAALAPGDPLLAAVGRIAEARNAR